MNLITNLKVRAKIVTAIRDYFLQEGFLEVETPLLVPAPSTEPYLEVFETKLSTNLGLTKRAFLTTSPEYAMKKLLSMGSGSSFQICKSFRNAEGIGANHNHEFTILEWYRTPGDYEDVMSDVEGLMRSLVKKVGKNTKQFNYQGQIIDLESPWIRLSIAEAFEQFVDLAENEVLDAEVLRQEVTKRNLSKEHNLSYDDLFQLLMLNLVEPNLSKTQPTFLYDYPATQAALARHKPQNPDWAERFEVFIGGLEIGNAFSELADADEQLSRMKADLELRAALGKTQFELDQDLVEALQMGLPPTGGIAVGVDRLVMLLTDSSEINRVIAFPTAKLFALRP